MKDTWLLLLCGFAHEVPLPSLLSENDGSVRLYAGGDGDWIRCSEWRLVASVPAPSAKYKCYKHSRGERQDCQNSQIVVAGSDDSSHQYGCPLEGV